MKLLINFVMLILSAIALVLVAGAAMLMTLPNVRSLENCIVTSMYSVKLCKGGPNYVELHHISPYVLHAVIAAEDGTFYSHDGFDWHEMEESFNANLHSGQIRRGGSTLTQQLAKNVFLGKEKSFSRKLKEAYLAHGIEKHYTKDFILEKYLNVVEFGQDLYGIKPASERYFHKAPSELNPLEAAYLAFLLPNPKVYSRGFKTGKLTPFARKMVATILKRMSSYGKLSTTAKELSLAQLGTFPWSGLSLEAFKGGTPSYSLDASAVPTPLPADEVTEEEEEEAEQEAQRAQPSRETPTSKQESIGDSDPE